MWLDDYFLMCVCVCLIQTGLTPLYYASEWGSIEAVHLLLDRGADINQVLYYRVPHLISKHNQRVSQ